MSGGRPRPNFIFMGDHVKKLQHFLYRLQTTLFDNFSGTHSGFTNVTAKSLIS